MHRVIGEAAFFDLLLQIDEDLAKEIHVTRCPCGGVLHVANYPRTLRGAPPWVPEGFEKRFSFCCKLPGCRQRVTPPSVRFFGRRWTVAPVMVLISALQYGGSKRRLQAVEMWLDHPVPKRTLERWRRWWREAFTAGPFWRGLRGRFNRPVSESRLPLSLIELFTGEFSTRLEATLRLLRPVTTTSCAHLAMGPTRR